MDLVQRALWYVETNFQRGIDLEAVARATHVSRFHLTRAFSTATGTSLMRYARRRRLTEAAKHIAVGAEDLLTVAIEYGYGSHEAFSRAFKEEFNVTPQTVRSQRHLNNLALTEALAMKTSPTPHLAAPRIETLPERMLAGMVERYSMDAMSGIPNQWQRVRPFLEQVNPENREAFGVCFNCDDNGQFDYMTAIAVDERQELPFGLVQMPLPQQKYAVFHHAGHISDIQAVTAAIWNRYLPDGGFSVTGGVSLEKYSNTFDPDTGLGGFEIWVAIQ
ncbi:MAG: AraC family transcriptional regulator [Cyanobacteria bacterium P01_E01_bin.45]